MSQTGNCLPKFIFFSTLHKCAKILKKIENIKCAKTFQTDSGPYNIINQNKFGKVRFFNFIRLCVLKFLSSCLMNSISKCIAIINRGLKSFLKAFQGQVIPQIMNSCPINQNIYF